MKFIKLGLAAAVLATGVLAVDESEIGISANMAMTSNYIWRGMTQTSDSPAIQGGFDLDYKGLYAGVWGSNVEYGSASMEVDVYFGYAGEVAKLSYDIGFVEYMYPNQMDELDFGEVYASIGYDFGVASIGAMYYVGVDTHNTNDNADWEPENGYELSVSAPLPSEFSVDFTYGNYDSLGSYYLAGVNKSLGKFDFTLAYTANDGGDAGSSTEQSNVVLTVATSF